MCRSAAASHIGSDEGGFNLLVRARNDMGGHETVADTFTGIGTSPHCSVHSTGFTTHHHCDVTTAHILTANQLNFRRLCHRVSGFDGGDHSAGLDHAQGNALH